MGTKYVIQKASMSHCPDCNDAVDLLCPAGFEAWAIPTFYICWACKKVFQVGMGPVEREDPEG